MSRSIALLTLVLAGVHTGAAQTAANGQGPVRPYDAEQQKRMAWFRQAKLGMFIHWGLYSIPGGQWPGRSNTNNAEWIMLQENIPAAEYRKLASVFNPVKFDAKAWVALAKAAGMKYLVFTAKHHDGFAMYHSKVSRYNIVDATPFKRDPMKELADACREAGIVFCVYYSVADWDHPDFPAKYSQSARNLPPWDTEKRGFHGAPNPNADISKYAGYMREQVRETLTNYGDVGIVWFDGGGALRVENRSQLIEGDELAAMIRSIQPKALINNRAGVLADYGTPEQHIPGTIAAEPFEVCMTLNGKWGYSRFDERWKSPTAVVRNIADIVSKGGNYLLNVGPSPEGEIPAPSVQILTEVGKWTQANAEAIYGAGPTPFGDELGREDPSRKDKQGHPEFVPREEWRCTTKPGKLFFTLLQWPGQAFTLPSFPNKAIKAYWLADPGKTALKIEETAGTRRIVLPSNPPAGIAPVLCLEIEGEVKPAARKGRLDPDKNTEA